MKTEPSVYSIHDLEKDGSTMWEGVRNYWARNIMRDEQAIGDLVLVYHSSAKPMGVAGVGRICSDIYPDPTQFDKRHKYHDKKASKEEPIWLLRDLEHVETFAAVVPLAEMKDEAALDGMMVTKRGMRLSVQPVDKKHFKRVLRMAKSKLKV